MKKLLLIGVILLALFTSIVSAEDIGFVYNDRSDINLKIPCYNSTNALCGTDVNCVLTVLDPDSFTMLNNVTMNRTGIYYNYTISQSLINFKYGEYHVSMYCVGSEFGQTSFIMYINPDSQRNDNYIIFIIIGIFVYGLLVFSLIRQEYTLGMIASMAVIILGIYVFIYGIIGITNWITNTFALINIAIGAYILLRGTTEEAMQHLGG